MTAKEKALNIIRLNPSISPSGFRMRFNKYIQEDMMRLVCQMIISGELIFTADRKLIIPKDNT